MGSVSWSSGDARRGPARGFDHLAKTGQASLQNGAHESAGDHYVGICEAVANLSAFALGLDDAGAAKHGQVLRDARLGCTDGRGQAADLDRTVCQRVQDFDASRAGERLEDLGLEDRDFVHIVTIDICADADECRPARLDRPYVTRLRAPTGRLWIVVSPGQASA